MFNKFKNKLDSKKESFFNKRISEGFPSKVILPEYELQSTGIGTKAVATLGLGLIGFAMTSGHKNKPRKINTKVRMADKGIVIEKATLEGKDLRIPWEVIVKSEKTYGKVILELTDGEEIIINISGYEELFSNKINDNASGIIEEGW